jgi:hypothetical protein
MNTAPFDLRKAMEGKPNGYYWIKMDPEGDYIPAWYCAIVHYWYLCGEGGPITDIDASYICAVRDMVRPT